VGCLAVAMGVHSKRRLPCPSSSRLQTMHRYSLWLHFGTVRPFPCQLGDTLCSQAVYGLVSGSPSPARGTYVCVSCETSDVIEDMPGNFLQENDVYFLFLQKVFQHRYPGWRSHAVNVEGLDFIDHRHSESF